MKHAAMRRLASDPVGVESDVVIPPTTHWHANMAVAPTATTPENQHSITGRELAALTQEEFATADLIGQVESERVGADHDEGDCIRRRVELEIRTRTARGSHLQTRAGRRRRSRYEKEIEGVSVISTTRRAA